MHVQCSLSCAPVNCESPILNCWISVIVTPLRRRNTRYKNPQLVAQHLFCCKFWRFSPSVINLSWNKNICCGLKKVVAKSRVRFYFEQQILALLLVFHQTHNLRDKLEVFVSRISPPLWKHLLHIVKELNNLKCYGKSININQCQQDNGI